MGAISRFMTRRGNGPGAVTGLGIAGAGIDGVSTYAVERSENPEGSNAVAAAKGVGTAAAWLFAEPLMWGITVGQGAVGVGKMMYEETERNRKQQANLSMHVQRDRTGQMGGTLGGEFQDSQNAYTMRQRQMDLLRQHKMSTEAVLGSEARQLHR